MAGRDRAPSPATSGTTQLDEVQRRSSDYAPARGRTPLRVGPLLFCLCVAGYRAEWLSVQLSGLVPEPAVHLVGVTGIEKPERTTSVMLAVRISDPLVPVIVSG